MTLFTQTESNVYLGKEINLDLNANITKEQIYFIKVTTNRGSSMKKVISSK